MLDDMKTKIYNLSSPAMKKVLLYNLLSLSLCLSLLLCCAFIQPGKNSNINILAGVPGFARGKM